MKKYTSLLLTPVAFLSLVISTMVPVAVHAQTNATTDFCYTFTRNLGEGRPLSSADAQGLQNVLVSEGFWNSGTNITSYDDTVASAVTGFQQKYASTILTPNGLSYGTGYVGSATRAEFNSLYGCSATPTSSPTTTQQTFRCPAGWTCSAPTQAPTVAYSCPVGWTCTPATTMTTPIVTTTPTTYNPYYNYTPPSHTPTQSSCVSGQSWNGSLCISSQDQTSIFTKSFNVSQVSGSILLAITADNEYSVTVNGVAVGAGDNYNYVDVYDITSDVHVGSNTLTITGVNSWNSTDGIALATNPAGLIYRIVNGACSSATISCVNNGTTITASDGTEQVSGQSALLLPSTRIDHMWPTLSGAQWIWDPSISYTSPTVTTPTVTTYPVSPIYVQPSYNTSSATLSLDATSPLAGTVQASGLPVLLVFDVMPQTPAIFRSLIVQISSSGVAPSEAYLYEGSTQVATAPIQSGIAQFSNIAISTLASSVQTPFIVKVDASNISQSTTVSASVVGKGISLQDSVGNSVIVTGSATGATITLVSNSFSSTKQVSLTPTSAVPCDTSAAYCVAPATSRTFNFTVTAGNNPLSISKTQSLVPNYPAVAITPSNGLQSYDTDASFMVTPGSTRSFSAVINATTAALFVVPSQTLQ